MKNFKVYKYIVSKDSFDIVKLKNKIETRQEAQSYLNSLIERTPNYLKVFKQNRNSIVFSKIKNVNEKEFILFSINNLQSDNKIPLADYERIKDLQNILKNEFENKINKSLQDFNKF